MKNQLEGISKEVKKNAGIEITPPEYEINAELVEHNGAVVNESCDQF